MPRSRFIRTILALALAYAVLGGWLTIPNTAHGFIDYDTVQVVVSNNLAHIDVGDTLGSPGTSVPVSLYLSNYDSSLQGFTVSITMSRPDLMQFVSQTTIDTCYPCLDSACTVYDTALCTVDIVPSTVQNTLIQNWDHSEARTFGGANLLVSGIADVDFDESPAPIPPFTPPTSVLIKVVAQVECNIPDTDTDRVVLLDINLPQTYLSTASGKTIPSYTKTDVDSTFNGADTTVHLWLYQTRMTVSNGSITVPFTTKGDLNKDGTFDVLDVVGMINVAFRGAVEPCPPGISDINCDGVTTVLDVVGLINHIFRGAPQPFC